MPAFLPPISPSSTAPRLAIRRGTLQRLILCVDLFCFDPDWPVVSEVQQSLLNPDLNPVEYRLINLFSPNATQHSIATLSNAWHHRDDDFYPLGRLSNVAALPRRDRSAWVLGGFFFATIPEGARKSASWSLSQSRFQVLSKLLADASRAGVKVDLVHLPMHAICLERYFATDRWSLYEQWISSLSKVAADHDRKFPRSPTAFWDFCDYHGLNVDPAFSPDRWFADPFHFKVDLGNLVIDRIMQFPSPAGTDLGGMGTIVTESNLQSHLARLRQDHEAYYDANPQVQQIHKIIRAESARRDSQLFHQAEDEVGPGRK